MSCSVLQEFSLLSLTSVLCCAGYFQVMKSFVSFEVEWPDILKNFLSGIASLTTFVTFDFVQFPGLGCLTKMPYNTKVMVMTLAPFFIGLAMWAPVLVLWCRYRWLQYRRTEIKNGSPPKQRKRSSLTIITASLFVAKGRKESKTVALMVLMDRLTTTTTYFWNNILTW